MSVSKEEVKKVANLARLEITAEEEASFVPQLSSILDYFEQIQELDTDDVPPMTRAIEFLNLRSAINSESNLKPKSVTNLLKLYWVDNPLH